MHFMLFWACAKRLAVFVVGARYEPATPNPPLCFIFLCSVLSRYGAGSRERSHVRLMGNASEAVNERYST